ncbi:ABC transporter permease [Streptomyces sp. NPDC057638]|uniref:ABC transporter permease n=1 Tax=Streptomyces sp. NPDC057638 TaxID=3346190 RepID=UPI0036CEB5B4
MLRTALRNVLAHKARLLMTVLAVMLGVAFVSGTLVFTDTLGNAFRNQSAKDFGKTAVVVQSPTVDSGSGHSATGLSAATLAKIQGAAGVENASGRVSGFAGVADTKGKLIGTGWANKGANFSPGKDGKDAAYDFTSGTGPTQAGQIALDKESARKGEYTVGETVRVATNGPVREFTLSGIFTTEDGEVNAGGSLVLFSTPVAQQLYLKPGLFHEINVTAAAGVSDDAVLADVKPLLPKGAEAETGTALADEQAKAIESGLGALNTTLLVFAGIALFVGVFLIANTFTMLVAQRTKELALMRAVGASRRQVKRSVILEAGLVGAVASVIGFGLGIGLAIGLKSGMDTFGAKIPAGPLQVEPLSVVAAFTVGVLITILAAWLPARRAAKIPPVAAMSAVHATATTKSLVVRNSIGALITLAGAAGIVAGAAQGGENGRMIIGGGAFFSLIGVIVLIPLLSRPMIALIHPLLRKFFGVSGKLAGQNAVRNPRRTGATASALAIGLTLVTGLTVLGVTLGQAIDRSTTSNIKADYLVTMASGDNLDRSAVTALSKAKGAEAVSAQQAFFLTVKGEERAASAVDPASLEQVFSLKTLEGSLKTLGDGQLAVAEKTAEKQGWKAGDTVPVSFTKETVNAKPEHRKLTIGAIYEDNEVVSPYILSQDLVAPYDTTPDIREVWIAMDGGETSANEQALVTALGDNPGMNIMDKQDIRNLFGGMINTLLNIMYGLLAMALIIAVLGVVNTLAMSVFERQQEIGMLRAIGLDRGKVKRMIRLEAVVISLFGAVIGVALGTFLAWAVGETLKNSIPEYALVIPWERIGIFLLLAGVVGILASLWPARSAARLNMLTAIKTE